MLSGSLGSSVISPTFDEKAYRFRLDKEAAGPLLGSESEGVSARSGIINSAIREWFRDM